MDDCMTTSSEQTVLELTRHFTPLAMRLARDWSLDLDDVKQEITVLIIETLPRIPDQDRSVKPYLYRTIRTHFLATYSEKYSHKPAHILSLDTPLPGQTDITRADTLAAPADVSQDDTQQIQREQALYDALHRLRCDEQEHMRRIYGLYAFQVEHRVIAGQRQVKANRSSSSISSNAFNKLRRDAALTAALEVTR